MDQKYRIGLLGKRLIIRKQFDRVAKYCMEIKCPNTHFIGMHVLTWKCLTGLHVSCFILCHSFTITLYLFGVGENAITASLCAEEQDHSV